MKKIVIYAMAFILILGTVFFIADKIRANRVLNFEELFKGSPLYTGGKAEMISDPVIQEMYPKLHGITDGSNYIFWMNEQGFIEQISAIDCSDLPDHICEGFDKEKAGVIAEEWFDGVFYEQIKELGKDKRTTVSDFSGGDFAVTIDQLYQGIPTGNTASISISGDGKLIGGAFIQTTLTRKELEEPVKIMPEEAEELAKKYAEEDCRKLHGSDTVLRWDEVKDLKTEFKVFNGEKIWDVSFKVPVDNSELIGNDEDRDDLYMLIRISAESGSCLMIASPYGSAMGTP